MGKNAAEWEHLKTLCLRPMLRLRTVFCMNSPLLMWARSADLAGMIGLLLVLVSSSPYASWLILVSAKGVWKAPRTFSLTLCNCQGQTQSDPKAVFVLAQHVHLRDIQPLCKYNNITLLLYRAFHQYSSKSFTKGGNHHQPHFMAGETESLGGDILYPTK